MDEQLSYTDIGKWTSLLFWIQAVASSNLAIRTTPLGECNEI